MVKPCGQSVRLWHLGNGGRVVAIAIWGSLLGASIIGGALNSMHDPWVLAILVVPCGFIIRSLFFRVTLDRSGIFVASWLRNYRVRDELIEAVLVAKYSGAITRFTTSGLFSRTFWVIGIARTDGRDLAFYVTIRGRTSALKSAHELGELLGVDVSEAKWI